MALDTLAVVSLDRLARSLSHLLEVVEGLQARGVFFRSLRDPVDTANPQGLFTLQVLGAAASLERALVRERTRSGMRADTGRVTGRVTRRRGGCGRSSGRPRRLSGAPRAASGGQSPTGRGVNQPTASRGGIPRMGESPRGANQPRCGVSQPATRRSPSSPVGRTSRL